MIVLTARINLISGNEITEINDVSQYSQYGNISSKNISDVINTKVASSDPFIVGQSKLGSTGRVTSSVKGVLVRQNPTFPYYPLLFELKTNAPINNLMIAFNPNTPLNPLTETKVSVVVNGVNFYDKDDTIANIYFEEPTDTFEIRLYNSAFIEGIYTNITIEIDSRNLISLNNETFDRGDISLPTWGIISNGGSISFNDLDGEINDYIEAHLLKKGVDVEMYITDTLSKKTSLVGKRVTGEWDYDNESRQVTVTIKDRLEEWQDITVKGLEYDPRNLEPWSLAQYYEYLYNATPAKYNMQSYTELGDAEKSVLARLVPFPVLETASLWAQWTKLCVVAQAHIYDENGKTVFKYNTFSGKSNRI